MSEKTSKMSSNRKSQPQATPRKPRAKSAKPSVKKAYKREAEAAIKISHQLQKAAKTAKKVAMEEPHNRSHRKGPANMSYKAMRHVKGQTIQSATVKSNPNGRAAALVRQVFNSYDMWEVSLLAHLAHPMHTYHLPGIDTTGVSWNPLFNTDMPWPNGRDTNGAMLPNGSAGATMYVKDENGVLRRVRQCESDRQMESNYHRFTGWITTQLPLKTEAPSGSNNWNSVIVFDPLDIARPIVHLNWQDGAEPWTDAAFASWTATPFVVDHNYVGLPAQPWPNDVTVGRTGDRKGPQTRDDSSDRWSSVSSSTKATRPGEKPGAPLAPTLNYDSTNFYYIGGAELSVKLVGANAFNAYSCLARDDAHTVTRFWTTEDNVTGGTTQPNFDYGATVQFSAQHNVGYAAYTGTKWGNSFSWATFDDDAAADTVRRGLNVGLPFIHFKYSSPSGQGTVPYLQIVAQTWLGIAPTSLAVAGSASLRTIPLTMPAWTSFCRARGATGADIAAAQASAGRGMFQRLAAIPTNSKPLNVAAVDPTKTHKELSTAAKIGSTASKLAGIVGGVVGGPAGAALSAVSMGADALFDD